MELANGHAASEKVSDLDGKPPESTDYANYFCTYSFLYHQACFYSAFVASQRRHIWCSIKRILASTSYRSVMHSSRSLHSCRPCWSVAAEKMSLRVRARCMAISPKSSSVACIPQKGAC